MGRAQFDEKFGASFVEGLPTGPGVYLFRDAQGEVIYVGKAKNLRRRLQSYRNATRRRVHRKMRTLVREANRLDFETQDSEEAALLRENALIRELHPPFNVDGAFAFLYPAIGISKTERHTLLCFTTDPDAFAALNFVWHGTFRSRPRAKAAFDALTDLLSLVGHLEKQNRLPPYPRLRGSRVVGLRQLSSPISRALGPFFSGQSAELLGTLVHALLAKPRARRDAGSVQDSIDLLKLFYDQDTKRLRQALAAVQRGGTFVPQEERDALFIRSAFVGEDTENADSL